MRNDVDGWLGAWVLRAMAVITGIWLVTAPIRAGAQPATDAGSAALNAVLDPVEPEVLKRASVVIVRGGARDLLDPAAGRPGGEPLSFQWHHYRGSAEAIDIWPASTIKVYALVAGLELLNELEMPTDSALVYHRRDGEAGRPWVVDCARTLPEMASTVFHHSDNVDYTLALRFVGVDRMNRSFLTAAKGFERSALMRDYTRGRPHEYVNDEPQRIEVSGGDGRRMVEHGWSGHSYNAAIGGHVIDVATGNSSSTRDMAEFMRRLVFHHQLDASERFDLSDDQHAMLLDPDSPRAFGGRHAGNTGLKNKRLAPAFSRGVSRVFPEADYYHKSGSIPGGGEVKPAFLDMAYVDDAASGRRFIMVVATESASSQTLVACGEAIARWVAEMD